MLDSPSTRKEEGQRLETQFLSTIGEKKTCVGASAMWVAPSEWLCGILNRAEPCVCQGKQEALAPGFRLSLCDLNKAGGPAMSSGCWLFGPQGQDEEDCLSVHTLQLGTL